MSPKKPSMPPVKRKRARWKLKQPIPSWFQTDLQEARKKHPEFYLSDFYYVRMLERNILTVQGMTFGLHPCILSKPDTASLSSEKGIVLAYLLVDALRGYAKAEWAWLNKDPGIFARAFQRAALFAQDWKEVLEDNGQLAKDLRRATEKVATKWTEKKAVEQAFLFARRRLIRDIRLVVDEIFLLPKSKRSTRDFRLRVDEIFRLPQSKRTTITNRLCANLLSAFNIKTHKGQSLQQLYPLVWKDRARHEESFREFDDMLRSSIQHKTSILLNYTHGNVGLHPFPPSRPPLPPYRISPMPQELFPSSLPYLSPSDFNPSDMLNLF